MAYIDNVLATLPPRPTDDIDLCPEDTCENIGWWYSRELDWSVHAVNRGIERELPFPDFLPNRLTLNVAPGKENHWFVNCKVDGVPLSIIATPTLKCGRIVAKVVTVYQWDKRRDIKQANRRHRTATRRIKRMNVKARRSL